MNESGITVAGLLELNPERLRLSVTNLAEHGSKDASTSASLPGFLMEQGADAVVKALDQDVFGLLFGALSALRELHEYTDVKKHPRGLVKWGKCSLKAPQAIELKLGEIGLPGRLLRFTLELTAEFQSLTLGIEDGAIRTITPGAAKASVGLKYGDKEVFPAKSTPEISFGKEFPYPGGLPIM
jgi:hypothetical protein